MESLLQHMRSLKASHRLHALPARQSISASDSAVERMHLRYAIVLLGRLGCAAYCSGPRLKFWIIHDVCNSQDAYLQNWRSTLESILTGISSSYTSVDIAYALSQSRPKTGSSTGCMMLVTGLREMTSASSVAAKVQDEITKSATTTCHFPYGAAVTSIIPYAAAQLSASVDDPQEIRVLLIITQSSPIYSPVSDGQFGSAANSPIQGDPSTEVICDSTRSWLTTDQIFESVKSGSVYPIVIGLSDRPSTAAGTIDGLWSSFLNTYAGRGSAELVTTAGGNFISRLSAIFQDILESASCSAPTLEPTKPPTTSEPATTSAIDSSAASTTSATDSSTATMTTPAQFEGVDDSIAAQIAISCGAAGTIALFSACYCLSHRFPEARQNLEIGLESQGG